MKRTEEHSQSVGSSLFCLTPRWGQLLSLGQHESIHRPICLMLKRHSLRGPSISTSLMPGFPPLIVFEFKFEKLAVVC